MKILIIALFISATYAQDMRGKYNLDIGEESCPMRIIIENNDQATVISKSYEFVTNEKETYKESQTYKTSKKMEVKLSVLKKKIIIETFALSSFGKESLVFHKSYTILPRSMRHSLVYQESDIEQMEFMRCLYIKE